MEACDVHDEAVCAPAYLRWLISGFKRRLEWASGQRHIVFSLVQVILGGNLNLKSS